jgi:hypothetical protein
MSARQDTTEPTARSTPIRVGARTVGEVRGDTFYKRIRFSVHALRVPPALALDTQSLEDAERAGAQSVEIFDSDSGHTYRAAISTIRARGFFLNRGFGEQIALSLGEWRRDDGAEQLSLFGVRQHEPVT